MRAERRWTRTCKACRKDRPAWPTRGRVEIDGVDVRELDPAQPVVCICHHGVRSAQVVAFLQRHGHAQAYNLAGGVDAWSTQVDHAVPRY